MVDNLKDLRMGWKIPCTTFVENIGVDIVPSSYFVVAVAAVASCAVVASSAAVASFVVVAAETLSFVRLLEGLSGLTLQRGHRD